MTVHMALAARAASAVGGRCFFNATAVAREAQGLLILGRPGSGKSSLGLALLGLGASLVADDGVWAAPGEDGPVLERPTQSPRLIEARGLGLLHAGPVIDRVALTLVVDLDHSEEQRLPVERAATFGRHEIPVVLGRDHPNLAAPVMQMLRYGRHAV